VRSGQSGSGFIPVAGTRVNVQFILMVVMPQPRAWALAGFIHRISKPDIRPLAIDDADASAIWEAIECIRRELHEVGVRPL